MKRPTVGLGFALRLAFSLVLLLGLLLVVDVGEIVDLLASVRLPVFLLLLALFVVDRLLMAGKWWLLLRSRGVDLGFWAVQRAYYLSAYAGLFLPSTLGADAVRAVLLRKSRDNYRVVASIALERGLGLLAQMLLAVLAVLVLLQLELVPGGSVNDLAWALAGLFTVTVVSVPLSFAVARAVAARLDVRRDSGSKLARLGRLAAAYAEWHWGQGAVWLFFGLSVVESFAPVVFGYFSAVALGIEFPFIYAVAIFPLLGMLARLPISVGGLGVSQVSIVYLAGLLGIPASQAVAIALLPDVVLVLGLVPAAFMGSTAADPSRDR